MAPTKPETTEVGDQVLDLVIPYIHNLEDRNSVSLVSRMFYEIDGITRKRLTVHTLYYPNPASLSKRFPFLEALTLKGPPSRFNSHRLPSLRIQITPWIEQLALEFRCLKELCIRGLVVHDEDLEKLAGTRGKDLRSLKIHKCSGFTTDGLRHVSKYCNQLRTFCFGYSCYTGLKDGIWLHQLASNSTFLEKFKFKNSDVWSSDASEDLTLLAKNCCNSLISLQIGECDLSKLGDAFRYAVRLENFGGNIDYEERELVGFEFPPNMRSLCIKHLAVRRYSIVLPFLNQIRKLKLVVIYPKCQCLLFERCPNLEVLVTQDVCRDTGLEVIGKFCKKLRKLTHYGPVTHVGLKALAKGCTKLECLKVWLDNMSNEALECVGTHLKNLCDIHISLLHNNPVLPLDNGVRAMLMGCRKLERLDISLLYGRLTDVGLEYIGEYGANLRSLSLTCIGESDAGLVKLSRGCPKLTKLKLKRCPFSNHAITSFVFNMPSLRYVLDGSDLALIRPEIQL